MPTNAIAMIGLAVMGANLARNIASRGYSVAVYNRTPEVTRDFTERYTDNLHAYFSLGELVSSLERPRKIMIMVKAGAPVDAVIRDLTPLLEAWDMIVDCGNSHYKDTIRREWALSNYGIHFVGCGVSGGEEWALHGPSIMPGGSQSSYDTLAPILEAIAAKDFSWASCVTHIGQDGAGHYVKMVHNGIEYGIMQMIAEAYEVYRKSYSLSAREIGSLFAQYNTGVLDSYLIDITAKVLSQKDHLNEGYTIDSILDCAGAKWTGLWTSIDALESGMSVSSIVEATFARMISKERDLRVNLWKKYEFEHPVLIPLELMQEKVEYTLYLGMLFVYAQWLALIQKQSETHGWDINLAEVTRIWQGGCIIRSKILSFLTEAFGNSRKIDHIFSLPLIHDAIHTHIGSYQEVLSVLIRSNIASPALSSALEYFYQMVTIDSSANLIQWLRDFFWAHTYERNDREGVYHTEWEG